VDESGRPLVVRTVGGVLPARALAAVGQAIWEGRLVAFPTDTVYGVGANAGLPPAVGLLFEAKRRPSGNALPVMVADTSDVMRYARRVPPSAWLLMRQFWPGPLTVVLERTEAICEGAVGGGPTVALRLPAHDLARSIIRAAGVPVAVTSANRSGEPPSTSAQEVLAALGSWLAALVEDDAPASGVASTVIDMTATPPRVVRWGGIDRASIERVVGETVG
jgi:L-threonylcarbamoyladenylate synthase